jgi:creatinine amidohydrolase/Fe(II)-dependent formamide hydrolase-like protein
LHPLGFLNFDRLNHFKHACNTKFVSNDQLTHESFKKLVGEKLVFIIDHGGNQPFEEKP